METFSLTGLSEEEVRKRRELYGPNRLPLVRGRSPLRIFLEQFRSLFIYALLIAGGVSYFLGKILDAVVIWAVVVINALIGFLQELKAERTLAGLQEYLSPRATVIREGIRREIPAEEVVPGDLLVLRAGMKVPADARLLEARNLTVDESALTGESFPQEKSPGDLPEDLPLAERRNMVFSGTLVVSGEGTALVTAIGAQTEFGRLAHMMGEIRIPKTPLMQRLEVFTRWISLAILGLTGLTFGVGYWRGFGMEESFMAAVALAVSAIPEGLPVILTVALAMGVKRMARQKAIIRYLPAVETLGSTTIIFTDKTGTLTENRLRVEVLVDPEGRVYSAKEAAGIPSLRPLLRAIAWVLEGGHPVDRALEELVASPADGRILDRVPFDSSRKYAAFLVEEDRKRRLLLKGAPEIVLDRCEGKEPLMEQLSDLARQGLRLLALASMETDASGISGDLPTGGFRPLGLVGFRDPPRKEAGPAVRTCLAAGIRVKMITGDHPLTAETIARAVGLSGPAVPGREIEEASPERILQWLSETDVVARATPRTKLKLIEVFKARGEIVAMTGDGVNDAPALKAAHIGVAMGSGTEVAKEAADMVLLDDNFATLVGAVKEGRTVFDNLRKTLLFIFPTNGGEGLILLGSLLAASVLPVLPLHILWINLVTTVALAVTLAFEPAERDLMSRPPRPGKAPLLDRGLLLQIGVVSVIMALVAWGGFILWKNHGGLAQARALTVNLLVFMEAFYLLNTRFLSASALSLRRLWTGNPALIPGLLTVVVLQLLFTYLPPLRRIFGVEPLPVKAWGLILAGGLLLFLAVEAKKFLRRVAGS
ncbi:MAG TPA: HAD family hydrolase [Thermosulfurimonas dismutans]|uniref:HAD family hydrolase n=1 Tax=Thermosulfurimonas dismutans TaxID=999894 RepID=A0A7C3CG94_9BACT|nr:HAD family hydrolase [Thermosulfurimonas dismutans]